MTIPMLFLPPQNDLTREWAKRIAEECPELEVIIPETRDGAEQAMALAEGAYGTIPKELLPRAGHLRWLQAPQAAPPAGYYYPELIAHPVAITNFREIYNDHIAARFPGLPAAAAQARVETAGARRRRCGDTSARGDGADRRGRRNRRRGRATGRLVRYEGDRH
jgi:hypothetical protein